MKLKILFSIGIVCWLSSFVDQPASLPVVPDGWPNPNFSIKNDATAGAQMLLGRILFYDPILSADSTISCASCHSPYNAFAHTDHAVSHGIHDSIGIRNAPALMNLAWQESFMWDGNVPHIDMQSLFPITHPAEMGEQLPHVISKLERSKGYRQLFSNAYSDTSITGERTLKALSAFMLSLVTNNAKYDSVMRKESKFSGQELKGYVIYKNNCASCHAEPLFTNVSFRNNGLKENPNYADKGRMKVTHQEKDEHLFKVPTLRNLEYSYPYMHDGRFKTLSEVICHYTDHIEPSNTLSPELKIPIVLSSNERTDLIAFLMTLNDRSFIFNPANGYPHQQMQLLTKNK